ncbi:2-dehydropantoate 2-reductase [Halopseudomonas sabulinigri]|uniref:2-dehydropantoate 2-reductase n=1 Tax=Halopseudomonas sabulinigri TaxID=472181 RepID=A0A1H1XAT0_9GAMM|nr:2-dehydropantoate 2-reductase [Halopseudomonas sabulinigri]SDT06131.1 2-dehydropantoate 2-reductase [Halopseudomonas sabulinigri]
MFHVLGAGSLGLLWIARLQQAGLDCRLLLRDQAALQRWQAADNLLHFTAPNGQQHLRVSCEVATQSDTAIAILIVATKAHAVMTALAPLRQRLSSNSQILLLQNGLGVQQQVTQAFPEQRVLYASVTDGAWQPAPQQLIWAGQGQTLIGDPALQPPPDWLLQLDQRIINWQWSEQILAVLWRKLAVNCAVNPFTLLFDCCNGEVPLRAGPWLDECITELQTVLAAQGIAAPDLGQQIHEVIRRTASNSSSMRQDLHAGRRTELSYILGYACAEAQRSGVPVPALERLLTASRRRLSELGLPVD